MKRFIAFYGSSNSGIQTKDKALKWAAELLGQGKIGKVHLCEVTDIVERAQPIITMKPFFVELEGAVAA
jgi:hypothetical protein